MNIEAAIKKAGSVRNLAEILGVTVQAVYQWQRAKELPRLRVYELREARPEWFPDVASERLEAAAGEAA